MPLSSLVGDPWLTDASPVREPKTRNRAIKACLECRQRKSKCDKTAPKCLTCQKNDRQCVYINKPNSIQREYLSRIKRKARSVENKRGNLPRFNRGHRIPSQQDDIEDDDSTNSESPLSENGLDDTQNLFPSPLAVADAAYDDDAEDEDPNEEHLFVVGRLSFTDKLGNFFRPKIADEINYALRVSRPSNVPDRPCEASIDLRFTPGPTYKRPNLGLLYSDASRESVGARCLTKDVADRLLNQYWANVHPIARTVHKPSLQKVYRDVYGVTTRDNVPSSAIALVSASLFAGLVSMHEEVYMDQFGGDRLAKASFEAEMQRVTEASLGCCNLAQTKNFRALQALVVYLIVLCRAHVGRSHLTLVASAIRLAESIGLNRDGTEYGRDPIATHVRRLVWYQLCFLDIRTTEAAGPWPIIRRGDYTTSLPLNVDDADLEQGDQSSDKFTDMTSSLIDIRCTEVIRSVYGDRARIGNTEDGHVTLDHLLARVGNFREKLFEDYGDMLDDAVPVQLFTKLKILLYTSRMYAMILQHYQGHAEVKLPARLLRVLVSFGIENLEVSMAIETNPKLVHWRWYVGALHQHHYALAMLMEYYVHPHQQEADRAWKCFNWVFDVPAPYLLLPRQHRAHLILTDIRDGILKYVAAQKVRCSREIISAANTLNALSLEIESSSESGLGHRENAVGDSRPSPMASKSLPNKTKSPPLMRGRHHHRLPLRPLIPLVRGSVAPVDKDRKPEIPLNWDPTKPMYPVGGFEKLLDTRPHHFTNGDSTPFRSGGLSTDQIAQPFHGGHAPSTAAQPFNYGHRYIENTHLQGNAACEATRFPISQENVHGVGMTHAPHRQYQFTPRFDRVSPQIYGSSISQGYNFGHQHNGPLTHAAYYEQEAQGVNQHFYVNGFGSHEHNGRV